MGEESLCGKEKYMKLTKNAEVRQYDDKKRRRISRKKGGLLVQCVCVCVCVYVYVYVYVCVCVYGKFTGTSRSKFVRAR